MTERSEIRLRHILDVIRVLVWRDQASRYQSTAMGVVWAIASPLLFLLTFFFLFRFIMNVQVQHYASFVFVGLVAWTWFATTQTESVSSIVANAGLVNQPRFPVAAIPIATTISNFINFLLTLPLLIVILLAEGVSPGVSALALPAVVACQFVLVLGGAYLVAALNVTFRDMQYIVPIVLQLGFFASGIFYDAGALPEGARRVLALNPMLHILEAYRAILIDDAWPDWRAMALAAGFAALLLLGALGYFRTARLRFLDEL